MVFSSLMFIFIFFALTTPIYYLLPRRFRNMFLFVVSLIFYGYGEPIYITLMLASVTFNYFFGILIDKFRDKRATARVLLILNVVVNLGLLGFFKYADFFVETLLLFPGVEGLTLPGIALPIGISFYTFQTMSYIIDLYRGNCEVQKNYIALGTYVALFPQLIAGPIVRYVDVADQLQNRRESMPLFNNGIKLFLVGMAKKVLIANQMGMLWDTLKPVLDESGAIINTEAGLIGSWVGILAFTFQIYFDFSGYSDMARGLGNMFGFQFVKNFDYPYISKSITEFWRRWHMTLGTWFREYVYIPLGGNRCRAPRHIFNMFVVWFLTGMWHGASWNFIFWGLYFFVLLVVEKYALMRVLKKAPAVVSHLYALFFIVLGWVVFEFTDLTVMGEFIVSLFTTQNGLIGETAALYAICYLPLMAVAALVCTPLPKKWFLKLTDTRYGWLIEGAATAIVMLLCTASLISDSYNPFLYFRF